MKGTVVATWISTSRKLWDDRAVDAAMGAAGWEASRVFTPLEDVEDGKILEYISALASQTGQSTGKIWHEIGKDNVLTFSKAYPSFFKGKNLYTFLSSIYNVHIEIVKKIPGANPPTSRVTMKTWQAICRQNKPRPALDYQALRRAREKRKQVKPLKHFACRMQTAWRQKRKWNFSTTAR